MSLLSTAVYGLLGGKSRGFSGGITTVNFGVTRIDSVSFRMSFETKNSESRAATGARAKVSMVSERKVNVAAIRRRLRHKPIRRLRVETSWTHLAAGQIRPLSLESLRL